MTWILGSSHPEHFKEILANVPINMTYRTGHHIPVTHQDMPSFACFNNLERSDHFSKNFKTIDLLIFVIDNKLNEHITKNTKRVLLNGILLRDFADI